MIFIDFHSLLNLLCVLGCSRVLILFLFLTLFFHPIFLRDSVPPCCKPAVVGLRGEYWVLVVAPPRCVDLWQSSQCLFFLGIPPWEVNHFQNAVKKGARASHNKAKVP